MSVTTTIHGMLERAGTGPVLLVAPHAGRRHPERRPWSEGSVRVNDLHTGDLTLELAERLDATALVNGDIDRNDIDLNRIRQVRTQAPWFLDLLCEKLTDLHRRHGRVIVLFIHGWNVVNPIVDVGIGVRAGKDSRERDGRPSTDAAFLARSIGAFRDACERHGIATGLGWRYPATNVGNLVQLFTGRHQRSANPRVREIANAGLDTNAVQLELSIPLRWPGPWRRHVVDACVQAFGGAATARTPPRHSAARTPPVASPREPPHTWLPAAKRDPLASDGVADPSTYHTDTRSGSAPCARGASGFSRRNPGVQRFPSRPGRIALQFQCADASVAGLAVLELGAMASGRLLVLPPGQGLYLFTGETPGTGPPADMAVGPLTLSRGTHGRLALTYEGPLLGFPDRTPFLDLETGLARAHVAEAGLRLDLSPLAPASAHVGASQQPSMLPGEFVRVSGSIRLKPPSGPGKHTPLLETSSSPIIGSGFIEDRTAVPREGTRVIATIPGHPGGTLRLLWRHGQAPRVHLGGDPAGLSLPADSVHIRSDPAGDGSPLLELPAPWSGMPDATLRTARERMVPVVRQGAGGRVVEHLLAFCEFESAGHPAGAGWVEVSS